MLMPTWIVEYARRRPTITRPLVRVDYLRIEVAAIDPDRALAAFRQRFPVECKVVSISVGSPTGMA
jgi:hypothetical protein